MLDNIRFVLCNTTHPGNIGAAARAMKTMGVRKLSLVSPRHFPDSEATARASGADDLLEQARVTADLPTAVADCNLVLGASARIRRVSMEQLDARQASERAVTLASSQQIAIVFGTESSGLSNQEMNCCNALVHIPSSPEYSSLNLGAAVQVLAYELRMATLYAKDNLLPSAEHVPAPSSQFQGMMVHFEQALSALKFLNPDQSETLLARLHRLMSRAAPSETEIHIVRGILSAAERAAKGKLNA